MRIACALIREMEVTVADMCWRRVKGNSGRDVMTRTSPETFLKIYTLEKGRKQY